MYMQNLTYTACDDLWQCSQWLPHPHAKHFRIAKSESLDMYEAEVAKATVADAIM